MGYGELKDKMCLNEATNLWGLIYSGCFHSAGYLPAFPYLSSSNVQDVEYRRSTRGGTYGPLV